MKLSQKSFDKLKGVHPDLVRVIERAALIYQGNFEVICGLRTLEQQKELLRKGATTTLRSRHLTGHAIDVVPYDMDKGRISWDWQLYYPLAKAIKQAAKELKIPLEWGGDWKSFPDGPHWQLPWKQYPIEGEKVPPQPRKVQDLTKSRTMQGGTVALAASALPVANEIKNTTEELRDVQSQINGAKEEFKVSDYFGLIISLVAIAAVLFMMYAKWTDSRSKSGL
jgi:peptidoglycan L-alanyl-D-glutamate endopeptidase CwlK